jgi:hypothetical protein
MTNLTTYAQEVAAMATDKSEARFTNSGVAHAAVVAAQIFKSSGVEVLLYTGTFPANFYFTEPVLSEMKTALVERKVKLRIVTDVVVTPQQMAKQTWICELGLTVELFACNSKVPMDHFMAMDDRAFRFETNDGSKTAIACFNEPRTAKLLGAAFEGLKGPMYWPVPDSSLVDKASN